MSWRLLEGSWRRLEVLWRRLGGLLETFEGFFGAPESILEASGGCLREYLKNNDFHCFSLMFEVLGACGTLHWRLKSIQNRVLELIMGTRELLEAS